MSKWTTNNIPKLDGKTVIVTGANSGIGFEAAQAIANKGAKVILAVRNAQKGETAIAKIKAQNPDADVVQMYLDLSDLESIREFAKQFTDKYSHLDLLINNAGVMVPPYSKTKDGFELQIGTNHLGHFALTGLLLDLIQATADSRIVNVASMAHKAGNLNLDDLNWEKRKYKKWNAYGDSKIANLYFTYELAKRLEKSNSGTIATAAHPGWSATELQRNMGVAELLNHVFAQNSHMGSLPTLFAATADVENGEYIGPNGFMEMKGYPKKVGSTRRSRDTSIAQKLWDISENLTGVSYSI